MNKTKVIITDKQKNYRLPSGIRMLVRRACSAVLVTEEFLEPAEVNVTFVDDEEIKKLNTEFRNIESSTDVLSFPMMDFSGESEEPVADEPVVSLGDIVISLEKAQEQADEYGHSFEREVAFLTVHSMLHLLGYDHMEEEEERDMRARQRAVMELLGLTVASSEE